MSYKHGTYGIAAATNNATEVSQGTIPVYIGSAPVHRINSNGNSNFDYSDYVNKPFLVSSLREAKNMGLYSDDWATYSLCEAVHAHFMNDTKAVAPIILLNLLSPAEDMEESAGTATVTMKRVGTRFVGYINDPLCYLDNIVLTVSDDAGIESKTFTYAYDGDRVIIEADVTFTSGKESASFTATATYAKIAFSAEKFTKAAVSNAVSALDYCEQITGMIPNVIAAPGISEVPELHALLIQAAINKLAGKWNVCCVSDIPATANTYAAAAKWKEDNGYDSKHDKVCWPALASDGKIYHMSTIVAYMMQNIDTENSNVPYVSTSNKEIFCDRAVVGENETLLISEAEANELNKVGITTVNIIKRNLRLWGAHMANYNHAALSTISAEDRFDVGIRMMKYMLNYLQNQHINEIDQSFTRKDIDSIQNSIQNWLDALVNDGMLLFAEVDFNNESNSDASIANGDFVFDLRVTYSVIAKSITFKLQYTSEGLSVLTTNGGDE